MECKNIYKALVIPVSLIALSSCSPDTSTNSDTKSLSADDSVLAGASVIYHGGDIVTMEGDEPQYVESLVVNEGKIAFVGKKVQAESKYAKAKSADLEKNCRG